MYSSSNSKFEKDISNILVMNTYPYVCVYIYIYIYILFRIEIGQKVKSFYEVTITLIGKSIGNPLQYSCLENPMGRGTR